MGIAAMLRMIATTIRSSIRENLSASYFDSSSRISVSNQAWGKFKCKTYANFFAGGGGIGQIEPMEYPRGKLEILRLQILATGRIGFSPFKFDKYCQNKKSKKT